MCGLVGMFSKQKNGFSWKDKTIFTQMLFADVFRGPDSTGIFAVNSYGNVDVVKEASPSPVFISRKDTKDLLDDIFSDYHIVVGHNRKATMGATSDANAHPFIEGNTVLVHNGTLTNHKTFSDKTVDSHAICHLMETEGYKEALKTIEGAYALIWYNAEEKTVYFTRNNERPLALVETKDAIYLASEEKMLDWILSRNDIKSTKLQEVPVGKIFKFNLDSKKLEVEVTPKKSPRPVQQGTIYQLSNHLNSQGRNQSYQQSSEDFAEEFEYEIGQEVSFSLDDFDIRQNSVTLEGTTLDDNEVAVSCWIDGPVDANRINALVEAPLLRGIVRAVIVKPAKNIYRLDLRDIAIANYTLTKNKIRVSTDIFKTYGGCCTQCGTDLLGNNEADTIKNLTESVVVLDGKNQIVNTYCKDCVEDLKNWRVMGSC